MRGLQKSKKVYWASDVNLCQVRLFLSDESPSQIGFGTQDHLQAKALWLSPPTAIGADDNLPPGFEGAQPANLWRNKLPQIPLMKWRCPPRFVLDFTWQVVAGEESKEVKIQNEREMRVLEAVYPRPSAIPSNPSVLMGIEDSRDNDLSTPLIPITPVEDEDTAADTAVDLPEGSTIPMNSQASAIPPALQSGAPNHPNHTANGNAATGIFPGVEADVAAAAYAALTAIMASNDQGSLIDQDLLIKILSDRDSIEKLIADHKAVTNPQTMPMSRPPPGVMLSDPPPVQTTRAAEGGALPPLVAPLNGPFYPLLQTMRAEGGAPPPLVAPPNGPFYPPQHREGLVPNPRPPPLSEPIPVPSKAPVAAKDINYYKSLIQQHGGERQENPSQFGRANSQDSIYSPVPRDLKPKIMKPCMYFNSSRGCRHGSNCSYQHDVLALQRASSMPEAQSAKRMKLDREITGA